VNQNIGLCKANRQRPSIVDLVLERWACDYASPKRESCNANGGGSYAIPLKFHPSEFQPQQNFEQKISGMFSPELLSSQMKKGAMKQQRIGRIDSCSLYILHDKFI